MTDVRVCYADLRDAYLRELATEGAADRTLVAYRRDLDDTAATLATFQGLAALSDPALDLVSVTSGDLRAAVAQFRERPDLRFTARPEAAPTVRARASVARRVAVLRAFFGWAHAEGRLPANPAARLRPGRVPDREPQHLPEGEARAILTTAQTISRWPERDLLIDALALASVFVRARSLRCRSTRVTRRGRTSGCSSTAKGAANVGFRSCRRRSRRPGPGTCRRGRLGCVRLLDGTGRCRSRGR